ncbi:hypothetical protein [Burkholderia gladioli]|uniref:hypothetical protein n=1 Tax=Burkholderia gladioli TaxID=28095 RepID=UPI00264C677A|nr:hypothetical protein [Burkholderia gladioli]MDN7808092.1 hypothetical protein [Burkholderia gladioli]
MDDERGGSRLGRWPGRRAAARTPPSKGKAIVDTRSRFSSKPQLRLFFFPSPECRRGIPIFLNPGNRAIERH